MRAKTRGSGEVDWPPYELEVQQLLQFGTLQYQINSIYSHSKEILIQILKQYYLRALY